MLAISSLPVQFLDTWERGGDVRRKKRIERWKKNALQSTLADVPELALVLVLVPRSLVLILERDLVPAEHACSWHAALRAFDIGRGRVENWAEATCSWGKYTVVPLDTNIRGGCTSAILAVLLFELREKSYSSRFTEQELHPQVSSEVKVDPGSSDNDVFWKIPLVE